MNYGTNKKSLTGALESNPDKVRVVEEYSVFFLKKAFTKACEKNIIILS